MALFAEAESTSPDRYSWRVAAAFLLAAVALGSLLPLWLDEIIQLVRTRDTSSSQLIHLLPGQAGAAPFGYLVQQWFFDIAGYSVGIARLPSAIFTAGAVWLTGLLGAQLGLRKSWLGAGIFALFPLILRYACESRPYSQGLFFSTLASVLFLRMVRTGGLCVTAYYALALIAAVYSQPYALLIVVPHFLWLVLYCEWKPAIHAAIAGMIAVLAFLPWYLWTRAVWAQSIHEAGVRFAYSMKTPLMLFRELAGAGYWGSGLLVVLACLTIPALGAARKPIALLVLTIFATSFVAVLADSAFGYFVATRQIIWVLPAFSVIAALGIERNPVCGRIVAAAFVATALWQSVHYFTGPKEDWQTASNAVYAEVQQGACLTVLPPDTRETLAFFHSALAKTTCTGTRMILAVTPYAHDDQHKAATSALQAAGYVRQSATEAGKSRIEVYSR